MIPMSGIRLDAAPALGRSTKIRLVFRPIMQRGGIEVGTTRPDDGMNFRVECDLGEYRRVAQRAVKFALENRLQVNGARQAIVKAQAQ